MQDASNSLIFSEDVDYSQTEDTSIWGNGNPQTLSLLSELINDKKLFGTWLHFASGDGRYNNILLGEADKVVATDIDTGALKKLTKTTSESLLKKLVVKKQNIAEKFPFSESTFDGF